MNDLLRSQQQQKTRERSEKTEHQMHERRQTMPPNGLALGLSVIAIIMSLVK